MIALECLLTDLGRSFDGLEVAIQGFDNVGSWAARLIAERGARVVAVSDITGAVENGGGLDVEALCRHVEENGGVAGFPGGDRIPAEKVLTHACDVLIPASVGGVLSKVNAQDVRAQIILEGANAPTMPDADETFAKRGIVVVPDILANAGGVTVSYFEWVQNIQQSRWTEERVQSELEELMKSAWRDFRKEGGSSSDLRSAAFRLGIQRVAKATELRA
jgi:glutamate dehydrogenase (NAD(P)+)